MSEGKGRRREAVREKTALLLAGRRALRRILSRVQLVRTRSAIASRGTGQRTLVCATSTKNRQSKNPFFVLSLFVLDSLLCSSSLVRFRYVRLTGDRVPLCSKTLVVKISDNNRYSPMIVS